MKILYSLLLLSSFFLEPPSAEEILKKVDANMQVETMIIESKMTVYGRRKNRVMTSKSWSDSSDQSFTEYLSPAREAGTKMLKLEDKLWIYSPSSDRTIQISGHLLRQSVMGSDLSYEDMMENQSLLEMYEAVLLGEAPIGERAAYILELTAKKTGAAYQKRKIWVDQERFVPLKEELFAKSGELLKRTSIKEVKRIGKRWYPTKINYKDMLKTGQGTDFEILEIEFNAVIPKHLFSKAALRK